MFKTYKMILHLNEIELENFKCFGKKQKINLKKITILTGANSSGKSSILHAISGLIQSTEMPFKFSLNGKYTNMGDFNEISYKHKSTNIITIGTKFLAKEEGLCYNLCTKWKRNSLNFLPELSGFSFYTDFFNLSLEGNILNFSYDPTKDPRATDWKIHAN